MSDTTTLTKWTIDPAHSRIEFKIKHLVISTVRGGFTSFDGQVETEDDDFENANVYFEADVNSINTNNDDRDAHLKSDDFFNAEKHPKLTFRSTSVEKTGDNNYKLVGDLTIRGNTKSVELNVNYGGQAEDAYGNTKAGFEVTGTINRKEFGLKWSAVTEAGQIVAGDKVDLQLDVQLTKEEE